MKKKRERFILWFKEVSKNDVSLVGGKNASLGEMYTKLTKKGIKVPNGFCITATAYKDFLQQGRIKNNIKFLLKNRKKGNIKQLRENGRKIRQLIENTPFPARLQEEIIKAYRTFIKNKKNISFALRSSATAEDLPEASFAGQQETFLNVKTEDELLRLCKKCFASLFTDRAISYREDHGFKHLNVYLSVGVQEMVRSDKAVSGVLFTIDSESGFRDVIYITASYGLGENIVKGSVVPDGYYVFKPTLANGFNSIIDKKIGTKEKTMVYSLRGTKNTVTQKSKREKFCLSEEEILILAKWGCLIEQHYKMPMDIEWAKDGISKKLFIVQARPETVHIKKDIFTYEEYFLKSDKKPILTGQSIGEKIGSGNASIILSSKKITNFKSGNILITKMTDPDWEPIMKKASGIITEQGGKTCHAAIVSRELGVPCIVGGKNATKIIKNNNPITIDCSKGDTGFIYRGILPYKIKKTNIKKIPKTKTKTTINLGEPEQAFSYSFLPHDGVGLAREEFIIASHIGVHPLALLSYNKLDKKLRNAIKSKMKGYSNPEKFFVDTLAYGIARITAAFYPKDVIVRFSDFKTNEYRNLVGGKKFEPIEHNPMIGFRGASRYYDKNFKKAFSLECKAIKKVREECGLTNLHVMVPFCRTPEEGKRVLNLLKENKLEKGKKGLKIIVMCEIPSNVFQADEFLNDFDGYSIGSNDLTQLILGVDRDNATISFLFDESNSSVKQALKTIIEKCKKRKKYLNICGQAPSDNPEIVKFLIKEKIPAMSFSPDSLLENKIKISKLEKWRR